MPADSSRPSSQQQGLRQFQTEPGGLPYRWRPVARQDLPHCQRLLTTAVEPPAGLADRWQTVWEMALPFCPAVLIEDLNQSYPDSILAFGLTLFVHPHVADPLFLDPQPWTMFRLYERILAGEPICLTEAQVAHANSNQGVDMVNIHWAVRRDIDPASPAGLRILPAAATSFLEEHSGYQIRSLITEVYGAQAAAGAANGGFRLIQDFRSSHGNDTPADQFSVLLGLRREWVSVSMHPMEQLFLSAKPLFRFTAAERRLLRWALCNYTDGEIGAQLHVSADTIKKRWQAILMRVELVLPGIFRASEKAAPGMRGLEKRRSLLQYLRLHREELRPYQNDTD